eukprot:TRINITY_DN260_c0_g1_i1.p4 TRINITY_DN260_c0_g1~~TRINITY_DN260_c0_g1_i1.p4  ORF type:complete len:426 (+),score=73.07 TRINITY_DN260_c0_g1_i1:13518-14795(+)
MGMGDRSTADDIPLRSALSSAAAGGRANAANSSVTSFTRIHQVSANGLRQETPAPLLVTSKGQLPFLPVPLARLATPQGTTRLHSLPAPEWHVLNTNSKLGAAKLFAELSLDAKSATCSSDCILFLTLRAVPSHDLLTDAPGRKETVCSMSDGSRRIVMSPADMCQLHNALRTDYCVGLSDGMMLHTATKASVQERRARRNEMLQESFMRAVDEHHSQSVLLAIQGGHCVQTRKRLARAAAKRASHDSVCGFSIEGLYAGESTEQRFECVAACVAEIAHTALPRVLLGGSGAPREVLRAVAAGVDVIEGDYPFEMAEAGMALRLLEKEPALCVRDRALTLSTEPLASRCGCSVCGGGGGKKAFSRGYVRHLLEVHEMGAMSLLAAHNVWQYLRWFNALRDAVADGSFELFAGSFGAAADARRAHA